MAKTSTASNPLVGILDRKLDTSRFREQHWEGTFWEYLDIVTENPAVARNAFQRVYDMILSYGSEPFTQFKQEYIRYTFFADPIDHGADAIFGLERPLMQLVDFFKSAAQGYGTEKRILLLHGPVGSSKSTIARLLKKGLENYSQDRRRQVLHLLLAAARARGGDGDEGEQYLDCPMHEEPLLLDPARGAAGRARRDQREAARRPARSASTATSARSAARSTADLMDKYDGDWKKAMEHVKVKRLILSEKDRRGIGTFQPKDEKNQDSTELTGDINYRKIAEYGSRLRPARVQLRRRAEHRQPRHRRVHRGAQARRRVPVRPARRVAGAHDQAEEVRPDLHRRGHPRPHERAGVQEAPGQRDDGGVPRPHHQDRRALQHPPRRRDQDLHEGLRPRAR